MNYDNIGEFIKERRKTKGLTQKELSVKLGVTDKAVSKWETGLGCPDVSILEILSKELGCSILELLKGREIVDEVIPVTEADDYIKESIKYGENNIKKIISKIIAFIVIFIVSILFILNIINIYNQRLKYPRNDLISKQIAEKIDLINKNISIIEKHQGKYSKEDYNTIISILHDTKKDIESNPYIKYIGDELSLGDLYVMDRLGIKYTDNITLLKLLTKYDNSKEDYVELIVESIGTRMFLGSAMAEEPSDLMYRYQIGKYTDAFDYNPMIPVQAREYDIYYRLGLYVNATKMIMEVGDIHE